MSIAESKLFQLGMDEDTKTLITTAVNKARDDQLVFLRTEEGDKSSKRATTNTLGDETGGDRIEHVAKTQNILLANQVGSISWISKFSNCEKITYRTGQKCKRHVKDWTTSYHVWCSESQLLHQLRHNFQN